MLDRTSSAGERSRVRLLKCAAEQADKETLQMPDRQASQFDLTSSTATSISTNALRSRSSMTPYRPRKLCRVRPRQPGFRVDQPFTHLVCQCMALSAFDEFDRQVEAGDPSRR